MSGDPKETATGSLEDPLPLVAKYGLPAEVKFCRKCVISNQRPNSAVEFRHTEASRKQTIYFDEEGVCDACRFAEKKSHIDWDTREKELKDLCDRYRRKDGKYDCIVSGSGGKDSFYAAHVVKYRYGMHPLTVTWAPHIYTDWGWKNFQSWIHAGFDNVLITPNGKVHRLLTRLALEKLFHPFQPFIVGQKAIPPKVSAQYNIPLIFYGENEAEYGNPIQTAEGALQDAKFFTAGDRKDMFLSGEPLSELGEKYGIEENDLQLYMPADSNMLESHPVKVHYLGYYLRWHPQRNYYYAVENGGFEPSPERTPGTYSKYTSIDDKMDDLHYYTTYIKFGIGRASYEASQEIRSGDITRGEGVSLVKRFDGEFPRRFLKEIWAYLSIDKKMFGNISDRFQTPMMNEEYFEGLCRKFRSPHLWKRVHGKWELRHKVWDPEWAGQMDSEQDRWRGNTY